MKFVIETEEPDEIHTLVNANKYEYTLHELKHNFWRKWKHHEGGSEDFYKGVNEVLDVLQEELKEIHLD